jgi:hypothetical protein
MDCEIFLDKHQICQLRDWRGTIREAIKDWDDFYEAVFNHVKDCDKCDPNEVLQAYWELYQQPKYGGETSASFLRMAMRYKRIGADVKLVKKFVAHAGYPGDILKYVHLFEDEELYNILCERVKFAQKEHRVSVWSYDSVVRAIGVTKDRLFLKGVSFVFSEHTMPPYEEVKKYAVIADVVLS